MAPSKRKRGTKSKQRKGKGPAKRTKATPIRKTNLPSKEPEKSEAAASPDADATSFGEIINSSPLYEVIRASCLERMGDPNEKLVAEFICDSRSFSMQMQEAGASVQTFDLDLKDITKDDKSTDKRAKKLNLMEEDCIPENLEWTYDWVVCQIPSSYCVTYDELNTLFINTFRCLKEGGKLMLAHSNMVAFNEKEREAYKKHCGIECELKTNKIKPGTKVTTGYRAVRWNDKAKPPTFGEVSQTVQQYYWDQEMVNKALSQSGYEDMIIDMKHTFPDYMNDEWKGLKEVATSFNAVRYFTAVRPFD